MNIHNCCLSCYLKCYPHDLYFGVFTNSFPLYSNIELKVNHFTGDPHIQFGNIRIQRGYNYNPKMWKLVNLLVDDWNANSYLQCVLTLCWPGFVLSARQFYCFMQTCFLFILTIAVGYALLVRNL